MGPSVFWDNKILNKDEIKVIDILELADQLFPFVYSEKWDNSGIQIGNPQDIVHSMVFSLDPTHESIRYAAQNSSQLLVTHHPLLFEPIKSITPQTASGLNILHAAKNAINILSLHTNLDAAPGGLNDALANLLCLENVITPKDALCARIGELPQALSVDDLTDLIAKQLGLDRLNIIGGVNRKIKRVFLVSGSGMGYLKEAIRERVDVMITGDVKYHNALDALAFDLPVIDAGHFGLEKICVPLMVEHFSQAFKTHSWNIRCLPFIQENPFRYSKP
jgi:dinuclear metal center YbgI/SA1388 family protein